MARVADNPHGGKTYYQDTPPTLGATSEWVVLSVGGVPLSEGGGPGPLSDNRLSADHMAHALSLPSGEWMHPDGDAARAGSSLWVDQGSPHAEPSLRFILSPGTQKRYGGSARILQLTPNDKWRQGISVPGFLRVAPGETLRFSASVWYSWQDSTIFRLGGVFARILFYDISGMFISSTDTATVLAPSVTVSTPGVVSGQATAPARAAFAEVTLRVAGNPHTQTGPGALHVKDPYFGLADARGGITEVEFTTASRIGALAEVSARSREKIPVELAGVDPVRSGGRVELAAVAHSADEIIWRWRQISGPPVDLVRRDNAADFLAPDVASDTPIRVGVYASSVDGRNRSDWHFFDLTIRPPLARFRQADAPDFTPALPRLYGYERGRREVWNDVMAPPHMREGMKKVAELVDLGIDPDDIQFGTSADYPPASAPAGGVFIALDTWEIHRNFGEGYNDVDDTFAAPRHKSPWVSPATGDVLVWNEEDG